MLYLEDYLEMIENLPIELRDKLTEMRELDLQVSNAADTLSEMVNAFFKKCSQGAAQQWIDEQMEKFRQEYAKVLEDADEKVQLANQSYELVERHMRKLDQEISKFKMELEADNPGITEIIERRVAESERSTPQMNNSRPEKRKHSSTLHDSVIRGQLSHAASSNALDRTSTQSTLAAELIKESPTPIGTPNSNKSSSAGVNVTSSLNSSSCEPQQQKVTTLSCNLGGSGSNAAIAVAASRAIGATVEMQQGRRTASLKASYEAVKKIPKNLPLGKEISSHATSIISEVKSSTKNKKYNTGSLQSKASGSSSTGLQHQQPQNVSAPEQVTASDPTTTAGDEGSEITASGWQADPNEPRYCICNDVSYGDMVGCDNEDCPLEWFHYGCVGLQQAPRGKWYCPQCITSMRRRGRK